MDGISRSRGWDKEIPYGVLPMEQLVLSDKWARILYPILTQIMDFFLPTIDCFFKVPEYSEMHSYMTMSI